MSMAINLRSAIRKAFCVALILSSFATGWDAPPIGSQKLMIVGRYRVVRLFFAFKTGTNESDVTDQCVQYVSRWVLWCKGILVSLSPTVRVTADSE